MKKPETPPKGTLIKNKTNGKIGEYRSIFKSCNPHYKCGWLVTVFYPHTGNYSVWAADSFVTLNTDYYTDIELEMLYIDVPALQFINYSGVV